jgi:hypothetical protein
MKTFRFQFHDQPESAIVFHETRDKAVNSAIYSMLDVGYGSTYREAMYSRPYKQAIAMVKSRQQGRSTDERYVKELLNGH